VADGNHTIIRSLTRSLTSSITRYGK
jgi:hypothetical protein